MIEDVRALTDDLVRDVVGRVGDAARDRAIALAVVQYGKDRPRTNVADVAAVVDGEPAVSHLPLPEDWHGDSVPLSIEWPIGRVPRRLIPKHLWALVATPAGRVLALPEHTAAGVVHRLEYTLPHALTTTVDTVPESDREAVAQYAAAILLDQVSTASAGDSGSTIKADAVDHGQSGPNYAERARSARKRYHDLLGIDPRRQQPASITVAPPMAATTGMGRLLFRRGR